MTQSSDVRRFLQGQQGIVESYQAIWHGRGFPPEKQRIRVDRSPDRCDLTAEILQQHEHGDWQPIRTQVRVLTQIEWEQVSKWIESGFWQQSNRDAAASVMDGDCWRIVGYREGIHHEVYRHTGSLIARSGAAVYELGRQLTRLAGLDGEGGGRGASAP